MSYDNEGELFNRDDAGNFKMPDTVGDYEYQELEDMVFAALDDHNGHADDRGFRTLPRIKAHAGLDRSFDLTVVIEGMMLEKKIRRCENGTVTAYFRYDQRPSRFWIEGDGTIGAEFDQKTKSTTDAAASKRIFDAAAENKPSK